MKHLTLLFFTISAAAANCNAQAVRCGLAEVAIIDRDTGTALSTHYYHGEYWVAGRPGARYSVEFRNRTGERLLAVTSVDGINVISGASAAWDQTGYVFAPWERYDITGWRKTDSEVAAFTFANSPNSYAEKTGRPANVGVIGVAVFRERRPEPAYVAPRYAPPATGQSTGQPPEAAPPREETAQSGAGLAAKTQNQAAAAPSGNPAHDSILPLESPPPLPGPKLGTGHGEREYSYVRNTEFLRMNDQPNAVIRIRYDSLENLVAMGVIPRPRSPWPPANPFPGSSDPGYVPDPPG